MELQWNCNDLQSLTGKHHTAVSRACAHAAWGHTVAVMGLHWGCGGATLSLLWRHNGAVMTHTASGRTAYYGEPRARMQLGATLGLCWCYTGAVVRPQ